MEYKFKIRNGIDDLKSLYAFHGNSQGDESRSNSIQEYLDSKGWMSFIFNCELTDEAISKEIDRRKEWNEKYIKELKEKDEYGKETEMSLSITYNPAFDKPETPTVYPLANYKYEIFNFDKSDIW